MKLSELELELEGWCYTVQATWEDTSFTHEYGTERCGYWDVKRIEWGGVDVTATLPDTLYIKLVERVNSELTL